MADKPKSTCPADRFNAVVNDPASRAAVNLQAALLYNRCRHRLRKEPAESALSQAFAEFPPSRASLEFSPSQASPELAPPQRQAFAEFSSPLVSPEIPASRASPEFSLSRAFPEIYPSRESPDFPSPQVPDKISFPPWFLTEESEGMENCQDMSRPRRSKKSIYRLQKLTGSGSQQKTVPSKLPRVFVKLCKISLPQSDQADDESDRTEDHGGKRNPDPSMVTYASDEEDHVGMPDTDPSKVPYLSDEEDHVGMPDTDPSMVTYASDEDVSFAGIGQIQIKRTQDTSKQVGNEGVSDGIEIDIDMTELIEDTDKSQASCESQAETVKDISLTGNLENYSSKNGRTTKKKRDLSKSSYKTALSEVSSCLTQKSRPLEILENNNQYESRGKAISEQGDYIDFSEEDADQRSINTIGSRKVTREIGENDLLGQQAERSENNNEPLEAAGTEGGKNWKQNHYISRWVPVPRKKKLYIEGELIRLDEAPSAPSASDSLYASSKILERFSERRVASKNSLYALEGPLRIPDPAVRPIPLFVIEKFRNGFPEDWKKVVDIWASFSDHKIIQKSTSPSDLAQFSQISSETGNICSMTNGSLISSMAADTEGNFLERTSTPAKEDLQRPKGSFQSEIASVHSQELYPLKEKDEGVNGAKGKSGKGTSKKGRKMESTPEK